MKSQSDNLLSVVGGICKDIRRAYPSIKGLDLDLERLSRLILNRGECVFTLDLPARESKLLQGLETGLLDASGTTRYSKQYPVPRLFAGLYMRIFDKGLCLRSDADINAIMFLRQLLCLGKKIETPCKPWRQAAAIEEYVNVEQSLIAPTLRWERDSLDCHNSGTSVHFCDNLGPDLPLYPEFNFGGEPGIKLLLQRCQQVADIVARELGTFCPDCFIAERTSEHRRPGLRHGPGAVAERGGKSFDKYRFTSWSDKLQNYAPWETTGKMPLDPRPRPKNHEVPARLICVPKTAKGPRIIAAEPSEHMFTQNLLADWLIERIDSSYLSRFIDFKDQAKSGKLVLKASLNRELATIDLSSASDRLSLWVVERVFRSNPSILKAIHATRTRWLRLPSGECIKLKKFASQGTALTFPVQTLVFLVIALAASMRGPLDDERFRREMFGRVRVYGDDIIVPATRYAEVTELLTALHLKVNMEKSFVHGYFRESCGVDAFKGFDITPIKPKTVTSDTPASCQAVLDTINNLFYKGYWNASEQLKHRQCPDSFKGVGIVGLDAGATGYVSFSFETILRRGEFPLSVRDPRVQNTRGVYVREQQRDASDVAHSRFPRSVRNHYAFIRYTLATLGHRTRWNPRLCRLEVRYSAFSSVTRNKDYDCGYSGLLQRQLQPSNPTDTSSEGIRGVPERPRHRKVMRWEALDHLFGQGAKG